MALVVGVALFRGDRVLAARRTTPQEAAGRWEFPGGKVEPGETPQDALVREVREELGCEIEVDGWLAGRVLISEVLELAVGFARLAAGEPVPVEHDQVRWLSADELAEVDWLEADRPFLPEVAQLLVTQR